MVLSFQWFEFSKLKTKNTSQNLWGFSVSQGFRFHFLQTEKKEREMEESKYGEDGPVGLWQDPDFPPSKESIGELNGDEVPDIVSIDKFVLKRVNGMESISWQNLCGEPEQVKVS